MLTAQQQVFVQALEELNLAQVKQLLATGLNPNFVDFEKVGKDIHFAIVHGGQGTVYAMASQGIPFIGIPFFNEQFWNIKKFSQQDCAYLVKDANDVVIEEVIYNFEQHYPMFKENIVKLSHNIKNESKESLKNAEAEIEKFIRGRQV